METAESKDFGAIRKQTRDWLTTHTLKDVRSIAAELENAGEDVAALRKALDELEGLLNDGHPHRPHRSTRPAL